MTLKFHIGERVRFRGVEREVTQVMRTVRGDMFLLRGLPGWRTEDALRPVCVHEIISRQSERGLEPHTSVETASWWECEECGEQFISAGSEDAAQERAHTAGMEAAARIVEEMVKRRRDAQVWDESIGGLEEAIAEIRAHTPTVKTAGSLPHAGTEGD